MGPTNWLGFDGVVIFLWVPQCPKPALDWMRWIWVPADMIARPGPFSGLQKFLDHKNQWLSFFHLLGPSLLGPSSATSFHLWFDTLSQSYSHLQPGLHSLCYNQMVFSHVAGNHLTLTHHTMVKISFWPGRVRIRLEWGENFIENEG